jgi:hypothetical protein
MTEQAVRGAEAARLEVGRGGECTIFNARLYIESLNYTFGRRYGGWS